MGTGRRYYWPTHWQTGDWRVRCIAFECFFVTESVETNGQARELKNHCEDRNDSEHEVLLHMHRQVRCVHQGCSFIRGKGPAMVRALFQHETREHHGATSMSRIDSFVSLFRQGHVYMPYLDDVKRAIFDRMMDHIHWTGSTVNLIYQAGGFPDPAHQTPELLMEILSPSHLRPYHYYSPIWDPIPPHLFLMNVQPSADAPANDAWREAWTRLRTMYAEGRI